MPEEIYPNIHRIKVPLPKNPLKYLNSYVITGQNRQMVIDTGLNRTECRQALQQGLKDLQVDLKKTDFFITHMHSDHSGLAPELSREGNKFLASKEDAEAINYKGDWGEMLEFAKLCGLPEEELLNARDNHPGYKYRPKGRVNFETVSDGQKINIDPYSFVCTKTPGHTSGHICLYEPEHKILIAGDHILEEITPNISQWRRNNPLSQYLISLEKIKQLEVHLVLPGHRRIFKDCKRRIQEIQKHHENRLDEVLNLLALKPGNAFELASRMSWDMTYKSWEEFPIAQKWFATGEALAHLTHLEILGLVKKELLKGRYTYSLKEKSWSKESLILPRT